MRQQGETDSMDINVVYILEAGEQRNARVKPLGFCIAA